MQESTFLAQLEQRTQQVKITLANLEAEKVRIESMLAQLQPLVPHYDALLAAERALQEAQISLHTPSERPSGDQPHAESPPDPLQEHGWQEPQTDDGGWQG